MRDKVAVIGVGCTKFGERYDRGYEELICDAAFAAYDDAGIDPADIEAAYLGTYIPGPGGGKSAVSLGDALRLYGRPITRVENYCATGTDAFRNACITVAAGVHVKAGKAKALATTGPKRDPFMPEVPTVAELGYPGYQATNWYAYVAPAKTPKDILARLNREIVKALNAPEVKDLLNKQGLEPRPGTPEELARFMKSEYDTWGRVVQEAKIKVE